MVNDLEQMWGDFRVKSIQRNFLFNYAGPKSENFSKYFPSYKRESRPYPSLHSSRFILDISKHYLKEMLTYIQSCSRIYAIDLNMEPSVSLETWNFTSDSPVVVLVSWSWEAQAKSQFVRRKKVASSSSIENPTNS